MKARSLVAEVTDKLHKLKYDSELPDDPGAEVGPAGVGKEVENEGHIQVGAQVVVGALPPQQLDRMVNFDEQTLAAGEVEDEKALDNCIRALRNLEFDENDLKFYFIQAELKMRQSVVKKNYTKFLVLTSILPKRVTDEVKSLLSKEENELGVTPYKTLKTKIFNIFGKPQNADFERAMARVLTGKPSQLCNAIINDLCPDELDGCHCHKWVFGVWHRQLPTACRQAISHLEFNKDNLEEILKRADDVFSSNQSSVTPRVAAVVARPTQPPQEVWDEGFHQDFHSDGQVAAIAASRGRGGRGGRGQGRGNFQNRGGGRGNRGGRGQSNSNQTSNQNNSGGQSHPRHKGPRHPDNPPVQVCVKHWVHGKSAHWCQEPGTCPWKDYYIPKSNNQ